MTLANSSSTTDDGLARIQLRAVDGTVWLTQAEIANLFDTTPQNVTTHLKTVIRDGKLDEAATCKDSLQVQAEGRKTVRRTVKLFNLDSILAVSYRVHSPRGTIDDLLCASAALAKAVAPDMAG